MSVALARMGTIKMAKKRTAAALAYAEAMKTPRKPKRPPAPRVCSAWPIVDCIRIALPLAPSVNALNYNVPGKGRSKTAAYRQWINDAGWIVKTAKLGRIVGPYHLTIFVPDSIQSDCSNRLKATEDLFVSLGVTDDDRFCKRSVAEKSHAIPKGECLVVIRVVESAQ